MNWTLLQNSLLVGVSTTVLALGLGFASALWLAGLPARLRVAFLSAAVIALALPPFLVTNSWLHYLGHTGAWHRWLPLNLFSLAGTVWVLTLLLWPVSLLLIWGAWQRLETAQLESDLLLRGWPLFRVLLFPLARAAATEAALIIFILAVNNFAVPAILQVKVLPAEMWIRFNTNLKTLETLRLSWPLVVGPLLLLAWLTRTDVPWPHLQAPVPGRLLRQQLGPGWFWSCGACSLLTVTGSVFLPLYQILSQRRTWAELPGAVAAGYGAIWSSLWYAIAAATVVAAIGMWGVSRLHSRPLAAELRKRPALGSDQVGRLARVSSRIAAGVFVQLLAALPWLAFLLPGVVVGLGLIALFNRDWTAGFYQSGGIVVLAFVVRYLAVGWYGANRAGCKVDRDLVDAARLEGATRLQLARHVVWPQIARTVRASWYLVFLLCLWDVESMILVVPPGGETLALRIFNLLHYGHNPQVNALCFTLLGVALVPLVLHGVWVLSRSTWLRFARPSGGMLVLLGAGLALSQNSCSPSTGRSTLRSDLFGSVEIVGARGVGVGQLNKPRSVAVDLADNLYVVDMTGRVQKFTPDGKFVLLWQMPQTDLGKPKGMCRDQQGNILVLEPHYSRVNVFTPAGQLLAQWGSHGTNAGQLSVPRAVAVNSHGLTFVSEYQEAERVQVFGPVSGPGGPGPTDSTPPRWVGGFGRPGNFPGEFNRAEGLCVDTHDRLYVADSCNHRIQVFSSDGKLLRAYGKPGKGLGELSYPYDICVDQAGRQDVCEFGNSRIQVFDEKDQPIEIIGGPGAEPGRFSNPWSVALDSAGDLYVADSQNHRVQKLMRRK